MNDQIAEQDEKPTGIQKEHTKDRGSNKRDDGIDGRGQVNNDEADVSGSQDQGETAKPQTKTVQITTQRRMVGSINKQFGAAKEMKL